MIFGSFFVCFTSPRIRNAKEEKLGNLKTPSVISTSLDHCDISAVKVAQDEQAELSKSNDNEHEHHNNVTIVRCAIICSYV